MMRIIPAVITKDITGVIAFAVAWYKKTAALGRAQKKSIVYRVNLEDFLVTATVPASNPYSGNVLIVQITNSLPPVATGGGFVLSGVSDVATAQYVT
ncbi:MAG: hypothetical protein WCI45_00005, partial [Desulfuromonadales bacterium]